MSALRIARPGEPVRLIDQGPSIGRRSFTRGAVYGGAIVVAVPPKRNHQTAEEAERNRESQRRYYERNKDEVRRKQNARREANKPRCAKWMPIVRETCGRRPGHADSCRSAVIMADEAARRWAGGGAGRAR